MKQLRINTGILIAIDDSEMPRGASTIVKKSMIGPPQIMHRIVPTFPAIPSLHIQLAAVPHTKLWQLRLKGSGISPLPPSGCGYTCPEQTSESPPGSPHFPCQTSGSHHPCKLLHQSACILLWSGTRSGHLHAAEENHYNSDSPAHPAWASNRVRHGGVISHLSESQTDGSDAG